MTSASFISRATILSLPLLACAKPPAAEDRAVRMDSAGVLIVENHRPQWSDSAGWLLSDEPIFQLGQADGDTLLEFNRIRRSVTLADGRIAIALGQQPQIRLFDRSGHFVTAFGRPGQGPGEFRSLNSIQRIDGDTIVALDTQGRRITAFAPDGSVAWLVDIRGGSGTPVAGPVRWGDGTLLVHREEASALSRVASGSDRAGQTLRSRATLGRFDRSGAELNIVIDAEGSEGSVFYVGGGPAMLPTPYGRNLSYALTSGTVLVGTQASYEIGEYDPTGKLLAVIRWPGPDLTVTPADIEKLKSELLDRARGKPDEIRGVEDFFRDVAFPPAKAAYGRLLTDVDDYLWVSGATVAATESPESWIVFDADRELLGAVRMPARFDLHEVGRDYVLGRWRDESGVEYIRMYSLSRAK